MHTYTETKISLLRETYSKVATYFNTTYTNIERKIKDRHMYIHFHCSLNCVVLGATFHFEKLKIIKIKKVIIILIIN